MSDSTIEQSRVMFAQSLLEGRLHKAAGDKRCGCGPCAHWVRLAARRAGISSDQLDAVLAPVSNPATPERSRRRPLGESRVQIRDSSTIRVRGHDVDPQAGFAVLLARLHDHR